MPNPAAPDLSHLSGREVEKVAEALVSSNLKTALANIDVLKGLKTEEMSRLKELVEVAQGKCGGIGCG